MKNDKKKPKRESKEYKVGYKKPPEETRWRPGQSGNPKGKPRGSRSLKSELNAVLRSMTLIKENGRVRKVKTSEALARRFVLLAMSGNPRALEFLLNMNEDLAHEAAQHFREITPGMSLQEASEEYAKTLGPR
jgi:hypothetical protein